MFGEDGALRDDLERADLLNWLLGFWRDLERFRQHVGAWQSFDEFLAFSRHVERLLWTVGLFPWEGPNGTRVEVPLFSDAAALLKQQAENE